MSLPLSGVLSVSTAPRDCCAVVPPVSRAHCTGG